MAYFLVVALHANASMSSNWREVIKSVYNRISLVNQKILAATSSWEPWREVPNWPAETEIRWIESCFVPNGHVSASRTPAKRVGMPQSRAGSGVTEWGMHQLLKPLTATSWSRMSDMEGFGTLWSSYPNAAAEGGGGKILGYC